ncbi:MAG: hypothetical protein PVI97_04435 [Candidatus Thiodiazotropha sp.]
MGPVFQALGNLCIGIELQAKTEIVQELALAIYTLTFFAGSSGQGPLDELGQQVQLHVEFLQQLRFGLCDMLLLALTLQLNLELALLSQTLAGKLQHDQIVEDEQDQYDHADIDEQLYGNAFVQ